jgi:hypothetical protein
MMKLQAETGFGSVRPGRISKGVCMSHNRDKEKKESKKKPQHLLKEKRKLKKEKKLHITPLNLTKHK